MKRSPAKPGQMAQGSKSALWHDGGRLLAPVCAASILGLPLMALAQESPRLYRITPNVTWTAWLTSPAARVVGALADTQRRELLHQDAELANESWRPTPFRMVGFGDSYAAGEGHPAAPGTFELFGQIETGPDHWHTQTRDASVVAPKACHQSSKNGLQLAVRRLREDPVVGPRLDVQVHDLSCSGSAVSDLLASCRPAVDDRLAFHRLTLSGVTEELALTSPQLELFNRFRKASLDRLRGLQPTHLNHLGPVPERVEMALASNPVTGPIDAITLSIGGNDAGFGHAVAGCAASDCLPSKDSRGEFILPGHVGYANPDAGLTNDAMREAVTGMSASLAAAAAVGGGWWVWAPMPSVAAIAGASATALSFTGELADGFVRKAHARLRRSDPVLPEGACAGSVDVAACWREQLRQVCESRPDSLDCRYLTLDQALRSSVINGQDLPTPVFTGCGLNDGIVPQPSGLASQNDQAWQQMFGGRGRAEQQIYILKYPSPLQRRDGDLCRKIERASRPDFLLDGIDDAESRFLLDSFVRPLQAAVERTSRLGWTVVSKAADRALGHSLCDPEPWVLDNVSALATVGARIPDAKVGAVHVPIGGGVAHPNAAGWENIGKAIHEAVRQQALRKVSLGPEDRAQRLTWRVSPLDLPAGAPPAGLPDAIQPGSALTREVSLPGRFTWDAVSSKADGYRIALRRVERAADGRVVLVPMPDEASMSVFAEANRNVLKWPTGDGGAVEASVLACQRIALSAGKFAVDCPPEASSPGVRIGLGKPARPTLTDARASVSAGTTALRLRLSSQDLSAIATEVLLLPFAAPQRTALSQGYRPPGLESVRQAGEVDLLKQWRIAEGQVLSVPTRNDTGEVLINASSQGVATGFVVALRQCSHRACSAWTDAQMLWHSE